MEPHQELSVFLPELKAGLIKNGMSEAEADFVCLSVAKRARPRKITSVRGISGRMADLRYDGEYFDNARRWLRSGCLLHRTRPSGDQLREFLSRRIWLLAPQRRMPRNDIRTNRVGVTSPRQ